MLLVISYVKGEQELNIFNRRISNAAINRAIVVISISIFIIITATGLLMISENFESEKNMDVQHSEIVNLSIHDIVFEVVSAYATVGLTLGITSKLTITGKIIIIILMIIGRLGPITMSIALFKKHNEIKQPKAKYPYGNVLIG